MAASAGGATPDPQRTPQSCSVMTPALAETIRYHFVRRHDYGNGQQHRRFLRMLILNIRIETDRQRVAR